MALRQFTLVSQHQRQSGLPRPLQTMAKAEWPESFRRALLSVGVHRGPFPFVKSRSNLINFSCASDPETLRSLGGNRELVRRKKETYHVPYSSYWAFGAGLGGAAGHSPGLSGSRTGMCLLRPTNLHQELPAVLLWLVSLPLARPPSRPSLPSPLARTVFNLSRRIAKSVLRTIDLRLGLELRRLRSAPASGERNPTFPW